MRIDAPPGGPNRLGGLPLKRDRASALRFRELELFDAFPGELLSQRELQINNGRNAHFLGTEFQSSDIFRVQAKVFRDLDWRL